MDVNVSTPTPARPTVADQMATIARLLKPMQRKVCALYWFDGLTQARIAQALRMKEDAVRMRIKRAEKKLLARGIVPPLPPRRRRQLVAVAQLSKYSVSSL